ncbi:hypothetical protein PTSG_02986 [Salpingoeca rosetta]|uniref:NAD(P)H-hydrate epimerase n=1 Tax=Salpingoeca rosetta (strain ATCC 50818 / BSB-021) TaxID=946362 RepID=F2U3X7_SALR5|nr:uncharacterized protein PTSG_02986 [Salpingoeca rosetta]EGD82321.1 hypothetical protein PTSG_02986 [Salpingoeca rosetta]|eukprot:XP_004996504.1 hypothetical protein PTSG_02986 [Salpingoeca rosetta]
MSLSMAARLIQFSALASMATMTNVTQSLPSLAYSCAQMQENEAKAAKASGLEMWTLMSRAGQAAYHTLRVHLLQGTKPNHITVLAGKGNNGGDGYVVAEAALKDDINVLLGQVGDHMSLKGDAATARDRFLAAGGVITPIDDAFTIPDDTDAIVDGLFGTGLSREIRQGPFTRAIDLASKSKAKKLAIDIPSGLHGDTGNVLGTVLSADATITFIGVKKGQFTGKAPQHVGILYFAGLGVEQAFDEIVSSPAAELVAFNRVRHRFMPLRPLAAHKAAFGKVVLLGGNNGMSGAIRLAGEACQRTGSGLTRTLTHPASQQAVMFGRPELMVTAAQDVNAFSHWIDWATVLAVGPGLGQDDWAQGVLRLFLKHASKPSVVDADALNLLAKSPQHNPHWVLTPHPGEAGRLLGIRCPCT